VTAVAPTSPSPTDSSQEIATGTIYAPQGYSTIYVHSQPSQSSSVVASVANGTTIGILCTTQGDVVTNQDTGQSSSLWDGTSDGYISDVYVDTGTNQATMTNC
jgi:LasA protease